MLQIITCHNAHLFEEELNQMFRLRHRVLVEQSGWEEIRRQDGRDIDQFDNDQTTYFLVLDDQRSVVGSLRMQPSLAPTLTSEIFSSLCNFTGVPRSEVLYDCSRVVADPSVSQVPGKPSWVTSQLHAGMFEFGLALGLQGLTCVLETRWLYYMRRWDWDVASLGLASGVGDTGSVAALIHTTDSMLKMLRRTRNIDHSVIDPATVGMIRCNHQLFHEKVLLKAA